MDVNQGFECLGKIEYRFMICVPYIGKYQIDGYTDHEAIFSHLGTHARIPGRSKFVNIVKEICLLKQNSSYNRNVPATALKMNDYCVFQVLLNYLSCLIMFGSLS